MKELKFGDMVKWESGGQMDKMHYKGVITIIETKLTIVDEDGHTHELCGFDAEQVKRVAK